MPTAPVAQVAPRWNLENLFAGGSGSPAFREFLDRLRNDLEETEKAAGNLPRALDDSGKAAWVAWIQKWQDLAMRLETAGSFAGCLTAAHVDDEKAHSHTAEVDLLDSRWLGLQTHFESFAAATQEADWQKLLGTAELSPIAFALNEIRNLGREKMPPEKERLAQELAVNGYHGWNRLYDKMAGDLEVEFDRGGTTEKISLGQLAMYMSNSQRDIRREAFEKLEAAWETQAHLASMALNYQAGFRLSLYRNRGWDSFLKEPLVKGRIRQATLEAMWSAVEAAVPGLVPYVNAKKKLLHLDRFCWYDQQAPVGTGDAHLLVPGGRRVHHRATGRFLARHGRLFTSRALPDNWVEAENRPGKGGGGFCTGFPTHQQTRIFMTWGGEYDHLMTLAHELGHAYHGWVLQGSALLRQPLPHEPRRNRVHLQRTARDRCGPGGRARTSRTAHAARPEAAECPGVLLQPALAVSL